MRWKHHWHRLWILLWQMVLSLADGCYHQLWILLWQMVLSLADGCYHQLWILTVLQVGCQFLFFVTSALLRFDKVTDLAVGRRETIR
ncbi:hypothetical protein ZOSMA_332G00030 [Zostera marina]|uniref:Uncharacterized protein n=1 Tax=Zostera marina TaxID=29655 RepID=A0A0K9PAB5_ZOSMR|nr:hypothetical protein ZOSMA_332G00030 [Zostera marina]